MAQEDDLSLKRNQPTLALKTADNFRFGQTLETVKDTFVRELRSFFAAPVAAASRFAEALTIDKYVISQTSTDPTENIITLIRQQPDILQKLPLISITGATGQRRSMGLGGAFVGNVQYPPRLRAANPEPYDLSAVLGTPAPQLVFVTQPDGLTDVMSTLLFPNLFFPTPGAVTAQQLANAINIQALYARARAVSVSGSTYLELLAGGPMKMTGPNRYPEGQRKYNGGIEPETPNGIEITADSTAALLTALGYTVGQSDDSTNSLRQPMSRYAMSRNLSIGLDVGATSDNERTEISDLLSYFLEIYLNDRQFTFYGQHIFEEPGTGVTSERYFQIVLGDYTMTGEADIPRPDSEREDKVFVNRFNIPVTCFDYVDRIVPANLIPPEASINNDLPEPS